MVLYSQLRQQTLQTLRGASKVTPYAEWQFVLHSAKIYDRMGCDLLGLDLGKFLNSAATTLVGVARKQHLAKQASQFGIGSFYVRTLAVQGFPNLCNYRRGEPLP